MDILIKSIIGGVVVALVLLVGKFFGPKSAGFMSAIPSAFVAAYILFTVQQKNILVIENFLIGGLIASFIFSLFIGVLLFSLKIGMGYWEALAIAYCFWGMVFGTFLYLK